MRLTVVIQLATIAYESILENAFGRVNTNMQYECMQRKNCNNQSRVVTDMQNLKVNNLQ